MIEVIPHSNDNCLEILIFGEIVIIFAEGLMAETNRAVLPVTENAIIASTFNIVSNIFDSKGDGSYRVIINFSDTFK